MCERETDSVGQGAQGKNDDDSNDDSVRHGAQGKNDDDDVSVRHQTQWKLSIVAIYTLFERLSQGFQRKPSCFRRPFNESHLAFVELSTKAILLS